MVGFGQAPPPWDVATILNSKDKRPHDVATTRTAICVNSLTMHTKNLEWVVWALGTASLYFFLDFYNYVMILKELCAKMAFGLTQS